MKTLAIKLFFDNIKETLKNCTNIQSRNKNVMTIVTITNIYPELLHLKHNT